MRRIVESGSYMFEHLPYTQVTLDSIGQRADVKKGMVSMYFGSKENLVLRLASQEIDRWFAGVDETLQASEARLDGRELAGLLAGRVAEAGRLPRLLSLLPVVLDHNLDMEVLVPFARGFLSRLEATGLALESRCRDLAPGDGARLVRLVLGLAAGTQAFANPNSILAISLGEALVAPLRVETEQELPGLVAGILAGS